MMLSKVGFSCCNVFCVLGERNREIQEFHYLQTLFKIKLTVTGIQEHTTLCLNIMILQCCQTQPRCFKTFEPPDAGGLAWPGVHAWWPEEGRHWVGRRPKAGGDVLDGRLLLVGHHLGSSGGLLSPIFQWCGGSRSCFEGHYSGSGSSFGSFSDPARSYNFFSHLFKTFHFDSK